MNEELQKIVDSDVMQKVDIEHNRKIVDDLAVIVCTSPSVLEWIDANIVLRLKACAFDDLTKDVFADRVALGVLRNLRSQIAKAKKLKNNTSAQ